jgi:hypothetical protein
MRIPKDVVGESAADVRDAALGFALWLLIICGIAGLYVWLSRGVAKSATLSVSLSASAARQVSPVRYTADVARQFAQFSEPDRDWLRNQHSPATGINCCSEADGALAEQDIRGGHYWVRFHWRNWNAASLQWEDLQQDWMEVPNEVVIHDPNRHGAPVVWWYPSYPGGGTTAAAKIRCFAPGLLV